MLSYYFFLSNYELICIWELVHSQQLPYFLNRQVLLIGDRRKYLACLVTMKVNVDQETLEPLNTLAPAALDWCRMIGSKVIEGEEYLKLKNIRHFIPPWIILLIYFKEHVVLRTNIHHELEGGKKNLMA